MDSRSSHLAPWAPHDSLDEPCSPLDAPASSLSAVHAPNQVPNTASGDGSGDVPNNVSSQASNLTHGSLVCFLSDPKSHNREEPIERIETADSILFVSGDHCYKLRRDMPLESDQKLSIDQRHTLALEEIKSGKSYAPDLYLGLVPVRIRDGQYYLDHTCLDRTCLNHSGRDNSSANLLIHLTTNKDPIADWLILMRSYDASKSLNRIVEVCQPNFTECDQLASLISGTSGALDHDRPDDPLIWKQHLSHMLTGFSPSVRQFERETKQQTMRACLSRARYRLDHLDTYLEDCHKRNQFTEIHGNVCLENVVQTPQGLQLVNPTVGCEGHHIRALMGDPLYDLAALIAELWARGLNRQANWVFSHYCNHLLDSHWLKGLQAMDLYLFVAAFEKAHLLSKGQQKIKLSYNARRVDDSVSALIHGYLQTARDSLVQDDSRLVIVGGSTQANRSNLARLLGPVVGRMPGAVSLSAYQEILALYDVHHETELPQSAHRQSVWDLVYRRLADKAKWALDAGYSVILSGAFDTISSRENLTILHQQIGERISLQAFYLFDPMADMKETADGQKIQPARQDLEYRSRQLSGEIRFDEPSTSDMAPILRREGAKLDWTNWIELAASCPVSTLVDQTLGHINPLWVPIADGTLH